MSDKIIGMTKEDVLQAMHDLDTNKYQQMFNNLPSDMIKDLHMPNTTQTTSMLEMFGAVFAYYSEKILYPYVSDLIELNNKKITEDVQKLLAK